MVGRMRYAPTAGYVRPFEKLSRFRPLRGRGVGVCDTPLRMGTCGPSKNYPVFVPFGAVCGAYAIRPYSRVRATLQKTIPFSSPSGTLVGRMRYAPTTGYVRSFEIPMRSPNWVRARVQKMDLYTPPSVAYSGAYAIRPYNRVRAALRKTVPFSSPSGPSVGRIRYAPTTGYVRPFEKLSRFRPLRGRGVGVFNTPLQPDTCGPSKNCPVFVPFGAACGAYAIRPYNRVRVILRNTDAISQPGTCGPSKNCPVFVPFGAVEWGVFNTPLRPGTCDSSKYRCNSPTGYVRPFKKLSRFRPLLGRLWGVSDTPLRPGTCGPSKNYPVFVSYGAACGAYSIRPYNRVRAALRKTVLFSPPSGPSVGRMRYAPTTGYVRSFEIPM